MQGTRRDILRASLLGLSLLGGEILAQGGPPLVTDDPGTPGDGVWEINLALAAEGRPDERRLEAPLVDLNYGVGERIQLKLEVPWVFLDAAGEGPKSGLGNSELGVKWRFLDREVHDVDMSAYPQFTFNNPSSSADRGLVEEGTELFLPLEAARRFGRFSLNPEMGFVFRQSEGDGWAYGLAFGFEAAEELELIGEVHGECDDAMRRHEVVFNLGLRWSITERVGLLAAAGRGLRGSSKGEPEFQVYLGLGLTL